MKLLSSEDIKQLIPQIGLRVKFMQYWKAHVSYWTKMICFKCLDVIDGGVEKLFTHLKYIHIV